MDTTMKGYSTTINGTPMPSDLEAYLASENALIPYCTNMLLWFDSRPIRFASEKAFQIIGDFPWPSGAYQYWCNVYKGWLMYCKENGVFNG